MMVFPNFFNFFAIFLKFSITRRVRTYWNDFFYFLPFSVFPNLFGLRRRYDGVFKFFEFFCFFFWNFLLLVEQEHIETIFFTFSILRPFPTYFGLKRCYVSTFLNFFAIFFEFSITLLVGTKRNDNFYFLSSLAFSNLFWLEMTS